MSVMYERIEALCYHNATTITAMCKELGISRSVLSELRSGRTKELSVHNLRKIADYFEIPIDALSHFPPQNLLAVEQPTEDEYFAQLYAAAKELNEENRQRLIELAHIFYLAQQATP